MSYLRIEPQQAKSLTIIAGMDREEFGIIAKKLAAASNPSIRSSKLLEQVKELSSNESFSVAFCSQLVSLATFCRVEKIPAERAWEILHAGMKVAELGDEVVDWYLATKLDFIASLECESIKLPAKALNLSTDFQQVFAAANVITDVRPVFDGDRAAIAGAIVTQTLRLKYLDDGAQRSERELSLALDIEDIDKLIDELEKARKKAECAKEGFGKKTGADIFVVGEETYGFS